MCIMLYIFRFYSSWFVNPHAFTLHVCPRILVYIYIYIYTSQLVSAHPYEVEVPCCAERTSVRWRPSSRRIGRGAAYCSRRIMRIRVGTRECDVPAGGSEAWEVLCLYGLFCLWVSDWSFKKNLGQSWPNELLTWVATAGRSYISWCGCIGMLSSELCAGRKVTWCRTRRRVTDMSTRVTERGGWWAIPFVFGARPSPGGSLLTWTFISNLWLPSGNWLPWVF